MNVFTKAVLVVVGIIGATIACSNADAADKAQIGSLEKMQKEMLSHTGQLNGNCSATMIYSDRDKESGEVSTIFLTAKHCVDGWKDKDQSIDIPVYHDNLLVKKERYIARTKGEWYLGDLAILELKDKQTYFSNTARIAKKDVKLLMGENVWTVGYPYKWSLTITAGLFGSLETQDFDKAGTEYFRATPDIAGGNSGGAMYHVGEDGVYELIGVTTARARSDGFIGLYTSIHDIHEYLKRALPDALPEDENEDETGDE